MISIRIKKLTKHFGPIVALHQLDLTINPGGLKKGSGCTFHP
jgi:ABC-type sugar transport system ATPase subunit